MPKRLLLQCGALLSVLLLLAWGKRPDGLLHLAILNVPGDAILLQLPRGGFVLIDGGNDPAVLSNALGRQLPYWQRSLEAVILSASDSQRLPGQIAALERYHAKLAVLASGTQPSATLDEWQRLVQESQTPLRVARTGSRFSLDGVRFRVLTANDGRLALRVEYGSTSAVLAHALSARGAMELAATGLARADLVTYPWQRDTHGPLLEALRPKLIVLTSGESENQPAEISFYDRQLPGATLLHPQIHGIITWSSNGRQSWYQSEQSSAES